jgi:16S rRNA (cytidine1402-2'-O)-methyltransferase
MALYIIPTPISENIKDTIPENVLKRMHSIKYFIVERARTARRFIKSSGYPGSIEDLVFFELDKRNTGNIPGEYLQPALEGFDTGLMSEAGMPGIADPGAMVISRAHDLGIEVKPLTGPSSIFLSLAASGMNGQNFTFDGYLPVKTPELKKKLQFIEKDILARKTTHIFIETPYRNNRIIEMIVNSLNGKIKFCIASEITGENEFIQTKSIAKWKKDKTPDLHKKTCIFLLGV